MVIQNFDYRLQNYLDILELFYELATQIKLKLIFPTMANA